MKVHASFLTAHRAQACSFHDHAWVKCSQSLAKAALSRVSWPVMSAAHVIMLLHITFSSLPPLTSAQTCTVRLTLSLLVECAVYSSQTLLLSGSVHRALPLTTRRCLIAVHLHIASAPPHFQLVWYAASCGSHTSVCPVCTLGQVCALEERHNRQDISLVRRWTLYLLQVMLPYTKFVL